MVRYLFAIVCLCVLSSLALGQEGTVIFKSSKAKSVKLDPIKDESAVGVTGGGKTYPADEILDVEYIPKPFLGVGNKFRPAWAAEEAAMKEIRNVKVADTFKVIELGKVIKKYVEAELAIAGAADTATVNRFARRQCVYKIAYLTAKQAELDASKVGKAIELLKAYKDAYKTSWQYGRTLQLLVKLQLENKLLADAEKTFEEIAAAPLPEPDRLEAYLAGARVSINAGKHPEALKKLDKMLADLKVAKDSPVAIRARVMQAECQLAGKDTAEVGRKSLRDLIKDTPDKGVKAAAYNALGKSLFDDKKQKEALWEFLWVDVVYNQDPKEHAKALYHLWRIFKDFNQLERAQECLDSLADPQYSISEYQAMAQKESKGS